MALYQVLYWKDIPAQVKVFPPSGRPLSRPLSGALQQKIDARAMAEGLYGTDDYLQHGSGAKNGNGTFPPPSCWRRWSVSWNRLSELFAGKPRPARHVEWSRGR